MAQVTICDGTGKPIEGEVLKRGYVIRRDYCEDAAAIVDAYQAEIDALHERLAHAWCDDLAEIRGRYLKQLKSLPDVPDELAR